MMTHLARLAADQQASAAAEMALVVPLLMLLLVVPLEAGYYFMSEHVVEKGVRDAARYASRLAITSYPGCLPTTAAEDDIQKVARFGDPAGTTPRLAGWTSDDMTTVTMTCDTSGTYTGIYTDFPDGVPVVTAEASVPYPTLFGSLVFGGAGSGACDAGQPASWACLRLNARSQAAVFGE